MPSQPAPTIDRVVNNMRITRDYDLMRDGYLCRAQAYIGGRPYDYCVLHPRQLYEDSAIAERMMEHFYEQAQYAFQQQGWIGEPLPPRRETIRVSSPRYGINNPDPRVAPPPQQYRDSFLDTVVIPRPPRRRRTAAEAHTWSTAHEGLKRIWNWTPEIKKPRQAFA